MSSSPEQQFETVEEEVREEAPEDSGYQIEAMDDVPTVGYSENMTSREDAVVEQIEEADERTNQHADIIPEDIPLEEPYQESEYCETELDIDGKALVHGSFST